VSHEGNEAFDGLAPRQIHFNRFSETQGLLPRRSEALEEADILVIATGNPAVGVPELLIAKILKWAIFNSDIHIPELPKKEKHNQKTTHPVFVQTVAMVTGPFEPRSARTS
jgi:hypothetical protein